MHTLFIDTSDNKKTIVGLIHDSEKDILEQEIEPRHAQRVLELLDRLLAKHKITLADLSAIEVNPGPGSFTGLRVGVSIANTLALSLNIPINNGTPGEMIEPIYTVGE